MSLKYSFLVGVILAAFHVVHISSRVELTNVKCIAVDESFVGFEFCRIKAVNRTYKYLNVKANLFKVPVTNGAVNVAVLKRFNGYKPFLYNTTIDGCKFLASQKKNILHNFFYSFISQVSNLNHSCPYDHDIILDKLTIEFLNYQLVDVLPAPEGDYAVFTNWYSSGISRAEIQVYGTLS